MRNGPFEGTRIRTSPWPRRATVWDGLPMPVYAKLRLREGRAGPLLKIHEGGIKLSIDAFRVRFPRSCG